MRSSTRVTGLGHLALSLFPARLTAGKAWCVVVVARGILLKIDAPLFGLAYKSREKSFSSKSVFYCKTVLLGQKLVFVRTVSIGGSKIF